MTFKSKYKYIKYKNPYGGILIGEVLDDAAGLWGKGYASLLLHAMLIYEVSTVKFLGIPQLEYCRLTELNTVSITPEEYMLEALNEYV